MANTIIPGDSLVVKKRAFGEIKRGDIIVFQFPKDLSVRYVFRVVGLPRETIEVQGQLIYVNGTALPEERIMVKPDDRAEVLQEISSEGSGPYRVYYAARDKDDQGLGLSSDLEKETFGINQPFHIPDNEYFVMGDNRDNSYDSRFWGTVPRNLVFGKPDMIYFSSYRDHEGNESVRWERVFRKLGATKDHVR